jgi:hypothetical protein
VSPSGPAGDAKGLRREGSPLRDAAALLDEGRRAYAARAWRSAYAALAEAERASELGAADLELLATSAAMLGRDDEWLTVLEPAHDAYLAAGDARGAFRCAFWIGVRLARGGEIGRATGWLSRAQRLPEDEGECSERGGSGERRLVHGLPPRLPRGSLCRSAPATTAIRRSGRASRPRFRA